MLEFVHIMEVEGGKTKPKILVVLQQIFNWKSSILETKGS